MLRTTRVAVVLALLFGAPAMWAQAKQAAAPKPAANTTEELLLMWGDIGRRINAMAEDFPEEKYDFKPSPEVRTFAEQLLHVAGANRLFLKVAKGEKWTPAEGSPLRKDYPTKAAVVTFVKKSFEDVAAYIKSQGDEGLAKAIQHPFADRMITQSALWWDFVNHASEHYGQLVVYYRVNGIVPPESRSQP